MANTDPTPAPSAAEIEAMRTQVAQYDAQQETIRREQRAAFLAPVAEIVGSPAFATVQQQIDALGITFDGDTQIGVFVGALRTGLRGLAQAQLTA